MKKSILIVSLSLLTGLGINTASAQTAPADTAKKAQADTAAAGATDVVGALSSNADYATAATAVKSAGLESTLKAGGPYTIFAPNNVAFSNLPQGQLDSLMKDPVKLATLLKGHVVTGKYAKADIIKALTAGKGKAELKTLDGQTLTLSVSPTKTLQLTNAAGAKAEVTLYDLVGANGIVNGINGILLTSK